MRAMPEGLEVSSVIAALGSGWDFDAEHARYAPLGAGSYHWEVADRNGARGFVTVDDLDHKPWLGAARGVAFEALRACLDTAVTLRASGLRFVVAPTVTGEGESLRRLDERHTIALFPFVDGVAGRFDGYDTDTERLAVVAMLAELHGATADPRVRSVGFELPGRSHLETALSELDRVWVGGPLSEPARAALKSSATQVAELLALTDRLADDARSRCGGLVVTHGEPHAGNVIRTSEHRLLVDWDTVALAPPERDLWLVSDGVADASDLYRSLSGRKPDGAALDFFRLAWDLKDLVEYLVVFRSPHVENDDTLRQYRTLTESAALRDAWDTLLP